MDVATINEFGFVKDEIQRARCRWHDLFCELHDAAPLLAMLLSGPVAAALKAADESLSFSQGVEGRCFTR